jgi:hypothetical protein
MAIEFRCEKCGKLLSVEAEASAKIKCQYCKATVQVPAGLASLPRPQVPGGTVVTMVAPPPAPMQAVAPPPLPGADQQPAPGEELALQHSDALMEKMSKLMPWVISVFLHAGVLLILAFVTLVVFKNQVVGEVNIPEFDDRPKTDHPGGSLNPGNAGSTLAVKSTVQKKVNQWTVNHENTATPEVAAGDTQGQISLHGIPGVGGSASAGGSAGGATEFGMAGGGSGSGPRSRFFGTGGNGGGGRDLPSYYVTYVIDHSGSMLDTFGDVKQEMKNSIGQLQQNQYFHVLFFAKDTFEESTARRMVPATEENKREALKYLAGVNAAGFGSSPIPALVRAFQVYESAPAGAGGKREGKTMFLLTDGEFETSGYVYKGADGKELGGSEAVLAWLKEHNKDKSVHVFTIVVGPPPSEDAAKVLGDIAEQNGGKYKFESAKTN